jgi:ABC-type nitrate/sulfonate/bicarbonate transport system substrate-binding protein
MRRHVSAWIAATLLLISSFGVAGTASAKEVVNIGVQPAMMPIFIARALGFLEEVERELDVEFRFHSFPYGAPENQALAAGDLQLASAGMGPAIVAAARLPAKLLAISVLEQTAIIVPAGSDVKSIEDLQGRTIAHPGRGSQQYPLLLTALRNAGIEDDVRLFRSRGSDIPSLVMRGDVDAGITWDPHVSVALASGQARVLMKAEEIMPIKDGHYIGNGFYGRIDFIERRPDVVQAVINAKAKAIREILNDPERAAKLWSDEIGFPLDVIQYSLREGISVFSLDMVPTAETIDPYTAFLKAADILRDGDDPQFDPTFARKALEQFD